MDQISKFKDEKDTALAGTQHTIHATLTYQRIHGGQESAPCAINHRSGSNRGMYCSLKARGSSRREGTHSRSSTTSSNTQCQAVTRGTSKARQKVEAVSPFDMAACAIAPPDKSSASTSTHVAKRRPKTPCLSWRPSCPSSLRTARFSLGRRLTTDKAPDRLNRPQECLFHKLSAEPNVNAQERSLQVGHAQGKGGIRRANCDCNVIEKVKSV